MLQSRNGDDPVVMIGGNQKRINGLHQSTDALGYAVYFCVLMQLFDCKVQDINTVDRTGYAICATILRDANAVSTDTTA